MSELNCEELLKPTGPTCLVVKASLAPVDGMDRFQPAGFPEIGHVIYKAPRKDGSVENVCIVDSAASMANHLESVCFDSPNNPTLNPDLNGLPYVACVTDSVLQRDEGGQFLSDPAGARDRVVCTSLTEGHRIASDYFLDGYVDPGWAPAAERITKKKGGGEKKEMVPAHWDGTRFREKLRQEFGVVEVEKNKKYFLCPEDWWTIYKAIFRYDPNALLHGVLFAKEQIKISRLLTAHVEAFGAERVIRSGVKFDRLGKTTSGQPIFSVDEETAQRIRASFVIDLALLRSYGRNDKGLNDKQKLFLLDFGIWKINRLLTQAFRYRSQCYLKCEVKEIEADEKYEDLPSINMQQRIQECAFDHPVTKVYYPSHELFKVGVEETEKPEAEETAPEGEEEEDQT